MAWVKVLHGLMMVLLLVAVGCSRKATPSVTTEVTDSTYTKEIPRPFIVRLPGDTVRITRLIECDPVTNKPRPFKAAKKSGRASEQAELKANGELTVTGTCDSLNKVIQTMDKEIYRLRTEKKKIVQPEYLTRDFDKVCRWYFAITVLLGLGFLFFKINKYF